MKLIYTLILLLFSSSVFAEFLYAKSSISDLLDYGFHIEQIDTVGYDTYVYHLIQFKHFAFEEDITDGTGVAICFIIGGVSFCKIDTQDKSIIEHLKEDDYLEQLNKELLSEEMDNQKK